RRPSTGSAGAGWPMTGRRIGPHRVRAPSERSPHNRQRELLRHMPASWGTTREKDLRETGIWYMVMPVNAMARAPELSLSRTPDAGGSHVWHFVLPLPAAVVALPFRLSR